jgi:hypothetical protein
MPYHQATEHSTPVAAIAAEVYSLMIPAACYETRRSQQIFRTFATTSVGRGNCFTSSFGQ